MKTGIINPNARTEQCPQHCWHATGQWLFSQPPKSVERCCHCGLERWSWIEDPQDDPTLHGPFAPYAASAALAATQGRSE